MAISSGRVSTATYLYCVVRARRQPDPSQAPIGIPGAERPSALKVTPSLWLIAAPVPLDRYGPGALEPLLGDLDQVSRIAVAHEEVVEHFAADRALTVVPMKLFTMFSSDARAVADIMKRRALLDAAMNRIAGAEEWGVRVTGGPARSSAAAASPASGTAFLAAKRRARDEVTQAKVAAAEAAVATLDRLADLAREVSRRTAAPPAGMAPPLLDAAFLVPDAARERFKEAALEQAAVCEQAGAQMTMTGPWPAYNFVHFDDER
jgi:hypothetical protein